MINLNNQNAVPGKTLEDIAPRPLPSLGEFIAMRRTSSDQNSRTMEVYQKAKKNRQTLEEILPKKSVAHSVTDQTPKSKPVPHPPSTPPPSREPETKPHPEHSSSKPSMSAAKLMRPKKETTEKQTQKPSFQKRYRDPVPPQTPPPSKAAAEEAPQGKAQESSVRFTKPAAPKMPTLNQVSNQNEETLQPEEISSQETPRSQSPEDRDSDPASSSGRADSSEQSEEGGAAEEKPSSNRFMKFFKKMFGDKNQPNPQKDMMKSTEYEDLLSSEVNGDNEITFG